MYVRVCMYIISMSSSRFVDVVSSSSSIHWIRHLDRN